MKINLEQIKTNHTFHWTKKSGFVDSGFVKTCHELVIERNFEVVAIWDEDGSELEEEAESLNIR